MTAESQETFPFSLLMSVYAGDRIEYVKRALDSNTLDQVLVPNQVVIIQDGPLKDEIQQFIEEYPRDCAHRFAREGRREETPEFTLVKLSSNSGLAHALNQGLPRCRYDLVARADSDDISLPARFSTIIPALGSSGYDVVGSAIQEFNKDEHHPGQVRSLPSGGARLSAYATLYSPLHHPSVAFRKASVAAVGGYPENFGRFEDYLLWESMILAGDTMMNLSTPLVLYRTDSATYSRRGGLDMFRDELKLQKRFHTDGFITIPQYLRNITIRGLYRLMPVCIRSFLYKIVTTTRRLLSSPSGHARTRRRNRTCRNT